jgi:hypothetical protein
LLRISFVRSRFDELEITAQSMSSTSSSTPYSSFIFRVQYYLHGLSRIIYEDKIGPALLRVNEVQNTLNDAPDKRTRFVGLPKEASGIA